MLTGRQPASSRSHDDRPTGRLTVIIIMIIAVSYHYDIIVFTHSLDRRHHFGLLLLKYRTTESYDETVARPSLFLAVPCSVRFDREEKFNRTTGVANDEARKSCWFRMRKKKKLAFRRIGITQQFAISWLSRACIAATAAESGESGQIDIVC